MQQSLNPRPPPRLPAGQQQPEGGPQVLGADAGGAEDLQAVAPEVLRALYPGPVNPNSEH